MKRMLMAMIMIGTALPVSRHVWAQAADLTVLVNQRPVGSARSRGGLRASHRT